MLRRYFQTLWNGGLQPQAALASTLRRRRMVSAFGMVMVPIAAILAVVETFVFQQTTQGLIILGSTLLMLLGLHLQAFYDAHRTAIHLMLLAFYIAPTGIILHLGLNTTNWVWLLPISLLANLLGSRATGLFWVIVIAATVSVIAILTNLGYLASAVSIEHHATRSMVAGSLLAALLGGLGLAFRSAQDRAERTLLDNLARLQTEVQVRREAERKAQAGERAKATFLAAISHELRTPLNGVIGAGQLLTDTELDAQQRELADVISGSGEVLLDLINNVLNLSKLEARRVELELQPFRPEQLVDSIAHSFRMMARTKGIEFEQTIASTVPAQLVGDLSQIRQILLNLCGNALKFTDRGGIGLFLDYQDGQLLMNVTDSGHGIDPKDQQHLFEPFSQVGGEPQQAAGTGLGLAIVRELVNLMQGTIEVDSTPGKGSTFTVSLPLNPVTPGMNTGPKSISGNTPLSLAGQTVLVADDNSVNRLVASKMLQKLGFKVVQAHDGEQAVQAVQAVADGNIDLVLMDIQMPRMDGLEATSAIRQLDAPLNKTPIIAVTAHAMPSDRDRLLAAGMNHYLAKPVRAQALAEALTQVSSAH